MVQRNLLYEIDFSGEPEGNTPVESGDETLDGGVLLIGCSGFRFSVRDQLGLPDNALFLHQTLANSIRSDSGWKATFEYAVAMNDLKNVVVCGHADCRVAQDSLKVAEKRKVQGAEQDLVTLREQFCEELAELRNNKVRADKLARLNVRLQVRYLIDVIERGELSGYNSELEFHGWYWSREESQFMDLKVSRTMAV